MESFEFITNFLSRNCGEKGITPCGKVEGACLQGILLNCRKYFSKEEATAFLKFVALLFEERCNEVKVERTNLISFYRRAMELVEFKRNKGRKAFKQ
jgi:hypothetical protein